MMAEWARWYEGKKFSSDWTGRNLESWTSLFAPLRDREVEILEIGSWEGRSAIFFLEFFRSSRLTCVDTFRGGKDHMDAQINVDLIEQRFDENTGDYGSRVEKIKERSVIALDRLAQAGRGFDVIYIDGSHEREDVMADSSLAWKILKPDGFIVWDDYLWGSGAAPASRPGPAIDCFLTLVSGEIKLLQIDYQVVGRKRASTDPPPAPSLPRWVYPRTLRNLIRFMRKQPFG